ncbi:hypothetical protein NI17_021320 [Thermobifida halotolerans]|uniref:Uncharacterized protein n=1 Tax=Thermobifida halotolerans TaxID=483545 RepID=A0A399FXN4_9ACTN|nr:DUF6412 domain-containing protein [Thermobifida halotolerans]UOE19253.1 hypothetical protein NI17_021320 [Thermobifida halotolerans]
MALVLFAVQALLFGMDGTPFDAGPLTVLAVLAVGAALFWFVVPGHRLRPSTETEPGARRGAMRLRQQRVGVVVSTAPNVPGKPRPRAPGAAVPAA